MKPENKVWIVQLYSGDDYRNVLIFDTELKALRHVMDNGLAMAPYEAIWTVL